MTIELFSDLSYGLMPMRFSFNKDFGLLEADRASYCLLVSSKCRESTALLATCQNLCQVSTYRPTWVFSGLRRNDGSVSFPASCLCLSLSSSFFQVKRRDISTIRSLKSSNDKRADVVASKCSWTSSRRITPH